MATVTAFTSGTAEEAYIKQQAAAIGLDPNAVLAVAGSEGVTLPAEVGDQGTSFGPWQLHVGGALPAAIAAQGASYANAWANSAAGINYALAGIKADIQKAGGPLTGVGAVTAQVLDFEHPSGETPSGTVVAGSDAATELAAATSRYTSGGGPSTSSGGGGGIVGTVTGDAVSLAEGAVGIPAGLLGGGVSGLVSDIPGVSEILNLPGDIGKAVGGLFTSATTWLEYEVPLFGLYAALTLLALVFLVLGVNRAAGGAPARAVRAAGTTAAVAA